MLRSLANYKFTILFFVIGDHSIRVLICVLRDYFDSWPSCCAALAICVLLNGAYILGTVLAVWNRSPTSKDWRPHIWSLPLLWNRLSFDSSLLRFRACVDTCCGREVRVTVANLALVGSTFAVIEAVFNCMHILRQVFLLVIRVWLRDSSCQFFASHVAAVVSTG